MQKKDITITVELDEQNIPTDIIWNATDLQGMDKAQCRAMLLSLWDSNNKDTLKLDLWTKKMTVDEMKIFFHQTLVTMADTFKRATNEEDMTLAMQDFCDYFAEKMDIKDN
ncbi:gliding motility protein GldC [Balneola sp. MJW-20]|uniref:gliding motility protein GldC n=1 Tax=Gracilimonas aurantiaca TaxID=3234185 RepID=UPI003467E486